MPLLQQKMRHHAMKHSGAFGLRLDQGEVDFKRRSQLKLGRSAETANRGCKSRLQIEKSAKPWLVIVVESSILPVKHKSSTKTFVARRRRGHHSGV